MPFPQKPDSGLPQWWHDTGDVLVYLAIGVLLCLAAFKAMDIFAWLMGLLGD